MTPPLETPLILECHAIAKSFGGLDVLIDVSLGLRPGRITALVGPNGAGKTTLLNVLSGFVRADAGSLYLDGYPLDPHSPHEIAWRRVARTFQDPRLIPTLTVFENVVLAAVASERRTHSRRWPDVRPVSRSQGLAAAAEVLASLELTDVADHMPAALPFGQQRLASIARALVARPRVLLADEPTVGLEEELLRHILGLLREIATSYGAVLIIEHNIQAVIDVADEVYVLDGGRVIFHGAPTEMLTDAAVVGAYFGRKPDDQAVTSHHA